MTSPATAIAQALADNAEAVCRRYLSKGHREGRYWLVGDVHNTPGRSLYVRLVASPDGHGQAGKWTDAQSGDHGDLLDIIAASCAHRSLRETLEEARRFLSLPDPPTMESSPGPSRSRAPSGTPEAARRLWSASLPLPASIAASYLHGRGIHGLADCAALRFHPRCYYRPSADDMPDTRTAWPAMIAAVTDLDGTITGVHRTWLDPRSHEKAQVAYPRRAMGHLLGHGVRFGRASRVMTAGEGIETILSVRQVMPGMPMIAGLSAAHLAAIEFPAGLERLYAARDADPAGAAALATLKARAVPCGIEVIPLEPELGDFNDDLRRLGRDRLARNIRRQLGAVDATDVLVRD
ncbi:DUF7146 domain-containing protein [Sphingomonas sp. OTU376]|uniref:DUF7146 domain-containing protein n=1 Tax=Sphingomonas sp. OTU376 TaxID=3043863 RepID=UPI00313AECDE